MFLTRGRLHKYYIQRPWFSLVHQQLVSQKLQYHFLEKHLIYTLEVPLQHEDGLRIKLVDKFIYGD